MVGEAYVPASTWDWNSSRQWSLKKQWCVAEKSDLGGQYEDDGLTVLALTALLQQYGGQGPASCVGFLYQQVGGAWHKEAIRVRGGVGGFVKAHPNIFKLIPPGPGERCPSIRLLDAKERKSATLAAAAIADAKARRAQARCKFFLSGHCARGDSCTFSHQLPIKSEIPPSVKSGGGGIDGKCSREEILRSQVLYYLSDDNLRRDSFFQGVIAASNEGWVPLESIVACPRMKQMGATVKDILEALRDYASDPEAVLELQEPPAGDEAVRRITAPPPLDLDIEDDRRMPPDPDPFEPNISDLPLVLIRDCSEGWQAVFEDIPRRSFMFFRKSTWPAEQLHAEMDLLEHSVKWFPLHSKAGSITRSTAWYVSEGCCCRYTYGDVSMEPQPRPDWLADIEARVLGEGCGLQPDDMPNSVNLNFYEDEDQNVGWHADDEAIFKGCERDCRVISASWGEPRRFEAAIKDLQHPLGRPSIFKSTLKSLSVESGDLCTMEGRFQKYFSHQIAKGISAHHQPRPVHKRINLTWRYIVEHKAYCPLSKKLQYR